MATYDPKAKKTLQSYEHEGHTYKLGDRVRYIGSSPCFTGKVGTLTKINREWHSRRSQTRAGFSGKPGFYALLLLVLWDGPAPSGPQSCYTFDLIPENEPVIKVRIKYTSPKQDRGKVTVEHNGTTHSGLFWWSMLTGHTVRAYRGDKQLLLAAVEANPCFATNFAVPPGKVELNN